MALLTQRAYEDFEPCIANPLAGQRTWTGSGVQNADIVVSTVTPIEGTKSVSFLNNGGANPGTQAAAELPLGAARLTTDTWTISMRARVNAAATADKQFAFALTKGAVDIGGFTTDTVRFSLARGSGSGKVDLRVVDAHHASGSPALVAGIVGLDTTFGLLLTVQGDAATGNRFNIALDANNDGANVKGLSSIYDDLIIAGNEGFSRLDFQMTAGVFVDSANFFDTVAVMIQGGASVVNLGRRPPYWARLSGAVIPVGVDPTTPNTVTVTYDILNVITGVKLATRTFPMPITSLMAEQGATFNDQLNQAIQTDLRLYDQSVRALAVLNGSGHEIIL